MTPSTPTSVARKLNPYRYYGQWAGHPVEDLETLHRIAKELRPDRPIVYLAGDSSLDNKYWVPGSGPAGEPLGVDVPEIYCATMEPPTPKPDVAFWINHALGQKATCINAAIEESMLRQREKALLSQDQFICDNITKDDILIVSVGCNDIAMKPTISTILHMLVLAWLTRLKSIDNGSAWALKYFARLFRDKTEAYLRRLCSKVTPRAIVLCMIYFPLEAKGQQKSWADIPLKFLGYNSNPGKLQAAIRQMFAMGTANVKIDGTEVIPCKLYEVMDGTRKDEYTERVEPSSLGGRVMAGKFRDLVDEALSKGL